MIQTLVIWVLLFTLGLWVGYTYSPKKRVIFSDPKHPFKQADEEVFFVSGTSPEEAFKESKTVDDFISKIKP